MGISHEPGTVMGRLWANAPGPQVGAREAAQFGEVRANDPNECPPAQAG